MVAVTNVDPDAESDAPVALVTGAARRIGAAIVRALHARGMRVALHYHRSGDAAAALAAELETVRADSTVLVRGDLLASGAAAGVIATAAARWGRLDALVNNASTFYSTALAGTGEADWDDLVGTNLKAPYLLACEAAPHLARDAGAIVNIVDIHGERPLPGHTVYCVAKAGLIMLTRCLARELGPGVRVNAVAPGAILWPEGEDGDVGYRQRIIAATPLARRGEPGDVAGAVAFLVLDARFTTGEVIRVDGGRAI